MTTTATTSTLRTVLSRIRTASSSSSLPPCCSAACGATSRSTGQLLNLGGGTIDGARIINGLGGTAAATTTAPRRHYYNFPSSSSSCCSNIHQTTIHAQPNQKEEHKPFSSVAAAVAYEHDDDPNNNCNSDDDRDGPVVVLTPQPGPHQRITRARPHRRRRIPNSGNQHNENEPTKVLVEAASTLVVESTSTSATTTESLNSTENKKSGDDGDGDEDDLPPPLPQPKYSVYKRVLPSHLTAFSSVRGRRLLMEAIQSGYAEPYFRLMEQFMNQSDPAYCGVTTLLVCLNASSVDPNIRWKGGWRFYASEDVLLSGCCLSKERILREGIVMDVFARLAKCHGLNVDQKHAEPTTTTTTTSTGGENPRLLEDITTPSDSASSCHSYYSLDDFRQDCRSVLSDTTDRNPLVVVSFSRQTLGQTGDGHFSPIAAYNDKTDEVLVLDVARFKYAPYWVSVGDLYRAMQDVDTVSERPRGWFILQPPHSHSLHIEEEDRRPVEVVPEVGQDNICPVNPIKVEFCQVNPKWREEEEEELGVVSRLRTNIGQKDEHNVPKRTSGGRV